MIRLLINYTVTDEINSELKYKWNDSKKKSLKKRLCSNQFYYINRSTERNTIRGKNSFFLKKTLKSSTVLDDKFFIFFHFRYYKLLPPNETIQTAILKSKTYSAPMYVPTNLKTSSNKILLSQWILLGNLPVMTNRGHFIINGTARVILHQLVRSPGVYFHQAKTKNLNQSSIDREIMSKIKTQQKMLNIDQKELSRNRMLKKRTNKTEDKKEKKFLNFPCSN